MISIVTPKPGKLNDVYIPAVFASCSEDLLSIGQVIASLEPYNAFIEAQQPDTVQYQLFKQVNGDAEGLVYIAL
jgi:hypothetical protein